MTSLVFEGGESRKERPLRQDTGQQFLQRQLAVLPEFWKTLLQCPWNSISKLILEITWPIMNRVFQIVTFTHCDAQQPIGTGWISNPEIKVRILRPVFQTYWEQVFSSDDERFTLDFTELHLGKIVRKMERQIASTIQGFPYQCHWGLNLDTLGSWDLHGNVASPEAGHLQHHCGERGKVRPYL